MSLNIFVDNRFIENLLATVNERKENDSCKMVKAVEKLQDFAYVSFVTSRNNRSLNVNFKLVVLTIIREEIFDKNFLTKYTYPQAF